MIKGFNRIMQRGRSALPNRLIGTGLILACCLLFVAMPGAARATITEPTQERIASFLGALRTEALAQGISPQTFDESLQNVQWRRRIIELDRNQPEGRMSFAEYRRRVISNERVRRGRVLLAEHRALLEATEARFGVPGRFVVALWGVETSYGANTGGFRVLDALFTLAIDGRRSDFFRSELLSALKIIDAGHISARDMTGSWAGAMGQSQFMPSSFQNFAVDGNGDGRIDIWTSLPDVFASAANYLAKAGWQPRYTWGRQVVVPESVSERVVGLDNARPLSDWQALGLRRMNGRDLPAVAIDASLIQPDGPGGDSYLVYENFRVLMRWNRSTYFATSVGLIANAIGG